MEPRCGSAFKKQFHELKERLRLHENAWCNVARVVHLMAVNGLAGNPIDSPKSVALWNHLCNGANHFRAGIHCVSHLK